MAFNRWFWAVARWVGAVVIGLFILSFLVGSGWCAGRYSAPISNFQPPLKIDVHVETQTGQNVEPIARVTSPPAWQGNHQLCLDHFIYDVGQAPAGRCDHLLAQ